MTIFTANALLNCIANENSDKLKDVDTWTPYIHEAYREWYTTQNNKFKKELDKYKCWVMGDKRLWVDRAPGNTCLSALSNRRERSVSNPLNDSKGCGGVMRVAPIGIACFDKINSATKTFEIGANAAAITHDHIDGFIPAGMLAVIIAALVHVEMDLDDAVYQSIKLAEGYLKEKECDTIDKVKQAIKLSQSSEEISDLTNIEKLGGGWTGDEALAIAIYCSLRYPNNFEKAVLASINHSGDSDSTGAITGNIMGALLGDSSIPNTFKRKVELQDMLSQLSIDMSVNINKWLKTYKR